MAENQKQKSVHDDEVQSTRFIEHAKQLEVDETGSAFERAIGVLRPSKSPNKGAPEDDK